MSDHAFAAPHVDASGDYVARCACGAVLRAARLADLAPLVGEHVLGIEVKSDGEG